MRRQTRHFTYTQLDSDRNFDAAEHSHNITESFQFPGEALLQADEAKRTAEIARLTYEAAVRDLRAAVETAYYQVLLDEGLIAINAENIANLKQVVHVTQVQYTAGQAAQSDLIGAELALEQAQLQQRQYQTNRLNDRAGLNQLLYRKPASPLDLEPKIELKPLEIRLDKAVDTATHARQEILEAALNEKNSTTALKLAEMEYLPNYTVGAEYDTLLEPGTRPNPNVHQGFTFSVGFTVPVFFWIHQREDVFAAQHSLQAARYSMNSVLSQTEVTVTQFFQSAQFAYESAQEYRGVADPLGRQGLQSVIGRLPGWQSRLPYLVFGATERLRGAHHLPSERQSVLRRRSGVGAGDGSFVPKMKRTTATRIAEEEGNVTALSGLVTVWLALSVLSGCDSPAKSGRNRVAAI